MKTLVVDDSTVMRQVLIKTLAQIEITDVDEAADGQIAVDAVEKTDYDLVLMDWNMPNMLGVDAVKEIRARGKDMPIMMVTTQGEKRCVIEAIKAGANSFMIKPFKPEELQAKIVETMKKASE